MSALRWSAEARTDLRRLADFLIEKDPDAAAVAVRTIVTAVRRLRHYPESAPLFGQAGMRKLSAGRYVVIYIIDQRTPIIARVHHASENWAES